jgi:hypothetical protein
LIVVGARNGLELRDVIWIGSRKYFHAVPTRKKERILAFIRIIFLKTVSMLLVTASEDLSKFLEKEKGLCII